MSEPCPLCADEKKTARFVKDNIPYYACSACDFLFSKPDTNANFPDSLESYEESYLDYMSEGVTDRKKHEALKRWIERKAALAGKELLDVGAGSGKWVQFLRQNDVDALGLEPAAQIYEHFLKSQSGFFCQTTSEFLKDNQQKKFDVVTSFDVLEHIEDPRSFLKDIHGLLKPGGYCILSLPNAGSVLPKIIGKHWHHYNKYHMSFFTRRSLNSLCQDIGFEEELFAHLGRVQSMGYIVQYFFDFILENKAMSSPRFLDNVFVPINFFDTMYLVFKKNR